MPSDAATSKAANPLAMPSGTAPLAIGRSRFTG